MVDKKIYFKIFHLGVFFILVLLLFLFNIGLCNDIKTVTSKISRCITCHGTSGNSVVGMWPKIAEQHTDYMFKQLVEFKKGKNGSRFDPTMFGMLQGIGENELLELAEYYSNQNLDKSKSILENDILELGKKIYLFGDSDNNIVSCVGCHGIDGMGNKLANYPILKWQHSEYLMIQLNKFKSGDRSNDINSIMRDIVVNMTDIQIRAVTSYISIM